MYKKIALLFISCLAALSVAAETESSPIPATAEAKTKAENPEIAYHLFSNWADKYKETATKNKAIAEGLLFGGGALFLGGSALTWYGGDSISESCSGSPMDFETKQDLTLGFGITGGALLLGGIIVAAVPIKDYRAIYSDVFQEKDPEVREAMAVSVLRYQADRGKDRRIASFIWSCALPILVGGFTVCANLSNDDKWSKDVFSTMGDSSWTMVGGVVSIFSKSPEERLYDRYLTTRDAYYGVSR
jgi:hypothetical protein